MAAHVGSERTWENIISRYYWPNMTSYVKQYIEACEICQKRQNMNVPSSSYLRRIQKYELLDSWSFDHLGPFHETSMGQKYLIAAIKNISRFVVIRPVKSANALEAASMLVEDIILEFRPAKYLTLDRGSAYTSAVFKEVNKIMAVEQKFTTAYHSQVNASAERMMRYIAEKLTAFINKEETNWAEIIPYIILLITL